LLFIDSFLMFGARQEKFLHYACLLSELLSSEFGS
jgi:hypothetical protein